MNSHLQIICEDGESYSAFCSDSDVASEGEFLDSAAINLFVAVMLYLGTDFDADLP